VKVLGKTLSLNKYFESILAGLSVDSRKSIDWKNLQILHQVLNKHQIGILNKRSI
jgi:hypothetical protein